MDMISRCMKALLFFLDKVNCSAVVETSLIPPTIIHHGFKDLAPAR